MILSLGRVNDHIINVGSCILVVGSQDNVHNLLESCWAPMEVKGEIPILQMAIGGAEDGLWSDLSCK